MIRHGVAASRRGAPAPSGIEVNDLGVFERNSAGQSMTFDVDLTGYGAGDIVYILATGNSFMGTSTTVGGDAATVQAASSGATGIRASIAERVLAGAGGAATTIFVDFSTSSASNRHYVRVVGVKGGTRTALLTERILWSEIVDGVFSTSITAPATPNAIIAMSGRTTDSEPPTLVLTAPEETIAYATESSPWRQASFGVAQNVTAGTYEISGNASGGLAVVAIALEASSV